MIYHFRNSYIESKLRELAGKMIQSESKMCDPRKTMQELTFEGLRAEYGFCDLHGLPFDWRLKPGGDGGIDFRICGRRVQMKYNNWRPPTGELYFRESQYWAPEVSFAILAVPVIEIVDDRGKANSLGGIEFIGWTGRKRFEHYARWTVWPGNPTRVHTMKAENLKEMDELEQWLFPLSKGSPQTLRQKSFFDQEE